MKLFLAFLAAFTILAPAAEAHGRYGHSYRTCRYDHRRERTVCRTRHTHGRHHHHYEYGHYRHSHGYPFPRLYVRPGFGINIHF